MNKRFIPSLLVAEVYFPVKDKNGFTADLIESFAADGFYQSYEIGDHIDAAERRRILELSQNNQLQIIQWLTFLIDRNNLDVSSLNSKLRLQSVKQIKEHLYAAAECGASSIAFVPGPDPAVHLRTEAMEGFYESLCDICEEAARYQMNVLIEPLDREAHKKRLVGPTSDAVQLLSKVKESYDNIGLAFDTAHAALNGEDLTEALTLSQSFIQQIHFSNAVLNPDSELYGDHHMPIGEPGFLDVKGIADILQTADKLGIQNESGLRIAVEVRGMDEADVHANEKTVRNILRDALNLM